ncbi:hypothetical protein H6764_01355 [Candidatus Nomurabacteria bacterium]|nr:hypothetical protein [Candidatus Nomurabacteria bacterium]
MLKGQGRALGEDNFYYPKGTSRGGQLRGEAGISADDSRILVRRGEESYKARYKLDRGSIVIQGGGLPKKARRLIKSLLIEGGMPEERISFQMPTTEVRPPDEPSPEVPTTDESAVGTTDDETIKAPVIVSSPLEPLDRDDDIPLPTIQG